MRKESEKMKKCQKCGAEYEEDKSFVNVVVLHF